MSFLNAKVFGKTVIFPNGALLYISFGNVYVRSSADEKSKILNKGYPLRCVAANLKNKRFICKLFVNNQLLSNTILDKKVGQNYNFSKSNNCSFDETEILVFVKT